MHDVLIIGAGPNGLLMAVELAQAGVRALVLERFAEPAVMPKANGLVGRVVSALNRRGLHELLSDRPPLRMPGFQFGALSLELSRLEDDNPMYVLSIPQRRLEELLERRARELGVEIRRGHEFTGLRQDDDGVTAEMKGPDGPYEVTGRFLIGADGGRSSVRRHCGIGFPGITDRGFVGRSGQVGIGAPIAVPGSGELDVPGMGRLRPSTFTRTERGLFAFGMFQPGLYRVSVFEWTPSSLSDSDEMPLEELREAVGRVLGTDVPMTAPADGEPLALRRTTGVNSRQADRYRHGRVFLTGDAAHVQSGVGGPGLNLGMQDVLNLAWKLTLVLRGRAPEELLDTYESERHPVGRRVIMSTRAQMALLAPGPNITALRELLAEMLGETDNIRRIADLMSGADTHYTTHGDISPHPLTGRWMPDLPLRTGDGPATIADLLRDGRPVLLTFAGHEAHATASKPWSDRVTVIAAATDDPLADALLIRPDGYLAWAGDDPSQALNTWFGP
jgi:2-polyprenyl-6-methoxyphenol hydroxylase-like FAD-dependent oxidoreductase